MPERMYRSRRSSGFLLEIGLDFQHHVVLVQLREHGRDLALAVGVVQRLIDVGGRNAEAGSGVAVEHHAGAQTPDLLIAGHVAQLRQLLAALASICGA